MSRGTGIAHSRSEEEEEEGKVKGYRISLLAWFRGKGKCLSGLSFRFWAEHGGLGMDFLKSLSFCCSIQSAFCMKGTKIFVSFVPHRKRLLFPKEHVFELDATLALTRTEL